MSKVKKIIKQVPLVNDLAKWFYFKLFYKGTTYWIDKYIENINSNIVQIGSNDGKTGDPIFQLIIKKKNWKILLVEPVPYIFEKLKSNYPDNSRFSFENVAINDGSKQIFYFIKEEANRKLENLPNWYDQLGSFKKENILKHLNGMLTPYICEIEITGLTLNELFIKNKVEDLRLLHIDTEGYDWKVLSQLDLKKHKPIVILFEHKHLQEMEKNEAKTFLENDYQIFQFGGDSLCIRRDKLNSKDINKLKKESIFYY
jgi:FkbM family methyltransferase